MQFPNIISAYDLARGDFNDTQARLPDGRYVPARPLGPSFWRWKATWLVWTGQADALVWPGQGYPPAPKTGEQK